MSRAILVVYALPLAKAGGINYICLAQFGERQRWWRAVSLLELETQLCDYFRLDWKAVRQALEEEGSWSDLASLSYEDAAQIRLV